MGRKDEGVGAGDDEKLGDQVKMAVFVGMLSRDLQDEIFKGTEAGGALGYIVAREKIKRIVGNRAMQAVPVPMDIGQVEGNEEEKGSGEWEGEECEVAWVGNESRCNRCGGLGHFARECGTPKGKWKE